MSRRPLVAVPAMRSARIDGLRRQGLAMSERIAQSVLRAGGEPVMVVPDPAAPADRLTAFDALLLPGGRDLDPTTYGQTADPATEPSDPEQDRADLALARAAVDLQLPTLAVCRGMQALNVALGGTLHQHLDDPDGLHRNGFHDVHLTPGSTVAKVMGALRVSVSSYHHQAIDRLAPGLEVVGHADDGCIEAVVHAAAPILGVQWHPEDDAHESPQEQALFDELVTLARHRAHSEHQG